MKQGEVWLVSLDPTVGAEIKKTRPAVIVNDDALGRLPKIIVPLTDWKEKYAVAPWMIKIQGNYTNKLSKDSAADCFQIRSISEDRCIKKIGSLDLASLHFIQDALSIVLNIRQLPDY